MIKCEVCDEAMYPDFIHSTLVSYYQEGLDKDCDHNDNCLNRVYQCVNGHEIRLSLRRKCKNSKCDWIGKKTCNCHHGDKVESWPEVSYNEFYIARANDFIAKNDLNLYIGVVALNKIKKLDYITYSAVANLWQQRKIK